MTNRLDGKVAVITGAASGIGAVTARRFVAEGCRVILGDIQTQEGQELADSLGDAALFCPCNVTSEKNVSTLVDLAVSSFGKLDIMFNNAGIVGSKGPIHTTPGEEWVATLDILVNGVFYGVKHAAKYYFGKKPADINAAEGAFLAIMLPSPRKYHYSIFQNKHLAARHKKKLRRIFADMLYKEYISPSQYRTYIKRDYFTNK